MSDWLRESLLKACVEHGVSARIEDERVLIQAGLVIEPRVFARDNPAGPLQVQVDFEIGSPRLGNVPFLDSFAGIGATLEEGERNAFGKFLYGSFHVILEALTTHTCVLAEPAQVEWEDWAAGTHAWRVCSGPLLMIATRHEARIGGYPEFFAALGERFRAAHGAGPHWMRVFLGSLDGAHVGSEVLVDGSVWTEGQEILRSQAWVYPPGYASLRHLLIALPKIV